MYGGSMMRKWSRSRFHGARLFGAAATPSAINGSSTHCISVREFSQKRENPLNEVWSIGNAGGGSQTLVELLSWGRGSSGQLGGGVEETRYYPCRVQSMLVPSDFRLAPVQGRLRENVSASDDTSSSSRAVELGISCGLFHSALLVDGKLFVWGKGDGGRLGLGSEETMYKPTFNPHLDGIRSVALGGLHSAALTGQGRLFTWGYGGFGALGHSVYHRELLPRQVRSYWEGRIVHLATSGAHTAVISDSGNSNFELGRGNNGNDWRPKPVPSLEGVRFIQIATGGYHSLALTSDGKVFTWGHGGQGQLGHGSVQSVRVPQVVQALEDEHVVYIACGSLSSAAVTDSGKLYMWGKSRDCQLGVPGLPDIQSTPVLVNFLVEDEELGPAHALAVAAGASHAMCLVSRSRA